MVEVVKYSTELSPDIKISEAAKKHFLSYLARQSAIGVRLAVKKSGCSGLSYVVDYVCVLEENDVVQPLTEKYGLFIDRNSYPYLKGIAVDYIKQGINFKLVFNNPNQKGQCGCGESFTVS